VVREVRELAAAGEAGSTKIAGSDFWTPRRRRPDKSAGLPICTFAKQTPEGRQAGACREAKRRGEGQDAANALSSEASKH